MILYNPYAYCLLELSVTTRDMLGADPRAVTPYIIMVICKSLFISSKM